MSKNAAGILHLLSSLEVGGCATRCTLCWRREDNGRPARQNPVNPTALDFFRLYLSDDIVSHLVTETNRYADQFIAANVIPPHSAVNEWKPTNADEMRAFLGLSLLTGLVYKVRLHMYSSGDAMHKTYIFGQSMARDRYLLLLRFLHFAHNDLIDTKDPDRDRLGKIRSIIDIICDRCATVYSQARDLCVDESSVLFKGCLAFKQFISTKRARFGIKLFELCTHSGFLLDFMVYHGKMSNKLLTVPDLNVQISEQILLTLRRPDELTSARTYPVTATG